MIGNKVIIVDEQVVLKIKVDEAFGVMDYHPWHYKVTFWTDAKTEYETKEVPTAELEDPKFKEKFDIPYDEESPPKYLYVKLSKRNPQREGVISIVGRGKTLLPKIKGHDFRRKIKLSGLEGIGFLELTILVLKYEILGYAP